MINYSTVLSETVSIKEEVKIYIKSPLIRQNAQDLASPEERCWVNWRFEMRDGGNTKVLCMPNGRNAKSNDPSTWGTLDDVVAAQNRFNGIGIVFTGNLLGIDLDHCILDGNVSLEIATFVEKSRTYTEISPSRTGLHLYLKLTEPLALEANRSPRGRGGDYECYTTLRYFTFTSQPWTTSYPVRTVSPKEALDLLSILGYPWNKQLPSPNKNSVGTISLADSGLLKKIFSSKNGAEIEALYNGDTSAYGNDDSAADEALCSHLAFWTGGNATKIESLWLASPLGSRNKTQDRKDYRDRTIAFALGHQTESYEPLFAADDNRQNLTSAPFLEFVSDVDLLAMDIPPVTWQIESLFEKSTLNMLSAPSHQYKSFLVLRMALSVAHGLPLFNKFATTPGNVLVVSEEDGISLLKHRYQMLIQDGEEPGGIFFVIQSGKKINGKWAEEIIRFSEMHNIQFVILDSLRALHTEKENDSDAMQSVMDALFNLTRKGLTVLFTHHHRKGTPGEQSEGGMDMARGSTAIAAAVQGHLTCQEKKGVLIISQPKLKAAIKMDPFILNIASSLEPEYVRFDYAGPYNDDMAAVDAMTAKLVLHFHEHKSGYFTRKRLAELRFATNAEDKTLRLALENLVEKKQLESKKYADLSDADQGLVPGNNLKPNTIVYRFAGGLDGDKILL